jgi:hypothetical protein
MTNVQVLLTNGILHMGNLLINLMRHSRLSVCLPSFLLLYLRNSRDYRERREHRVFTKLLQMVPGLEERLMNSSEEEVVFVADLVCLDHNLIPSMPLTLIR